MEIVIAIASLVAVLAVIGYDAWYSRKLARAYHEGCADARDGFAPLCDSIGYEAAELESYMQGYRTVRNLKLTDVLSHRIDA